MEWYSKSKKIEFCCAIGMTGNYSHPIIYTPCIVLIVEYKVSLAFWLYSKRMYFMRLL